MLGVAAMGLAAWSPPWRVFLLPAAILVATIAVGCYRSGLFTTRQLLALGVLGRLLLLPLPPTLSDDSFRYVWDGLLQVNGVNPYAYLPSDSALEAFHGEPIFELLNSKHYYSVYPPPSQAVFLLGALVYGAGWQASYYLTKVVLVAAELAALVLLGRLAPAAALALYALNPVALLETAGQAHTEGLMLLGLVGTFWALERRRPTLAAASIATAAWVKLYPLVLIPFVLRRTGWRYLWVVALVSGLLAWPYLTPAAIGHVLSSLDLYVRDFEFNAGPYYAAKWLLNTLELDGRIGWGRIIGPLFRALFLLSIPVLYALDKRLELRFAGVVVLIFATYFVLATTIHPWYLLGILVAIPLLKTPAWNWLWLSLALVGTYLFYTTEAYWPFIWAGWIGWLVLAMQPSRWRDRLETLMRHRAREKVDVVRSVLPAGSHLPVLDLGAGDGYVSELLTDQEARPVVAVDVVDFNRTRLPLTVYDGENLPFADSSFSGVLLIYVLHHCEEPAQVVREALRVSNGPVIVVESLAQGPLSERLLPLLDRFANRVRSFGALRGQEEHVRFRGASEWIALFQSCGATILDVSYGRGAVHRAVRFVLEARG